MADRIEVLALDLSDLASVRAAAEQLIARGGRIDGLINNAGVAGARGQTRNGFELAFGVNHLGHFLFTRLLEARLRESAPARVVNVSSEAHRRINGIDFAALREPTKTRTGLYEYGVSKLCNILFTREIARRWAGSGITGVRAPPRRHRDRHLAKRPPAVALATDPLDEDPGGRRRHHHPLRDRPRACQR